MQIVFVHGVNVRRVRSGDAYDAAVAKRHASFQKHLLAGRIAKFYDPYWGEWGAPDGSQFKSVPRGSGTALSAQSGVRNAAADLAPDAVLQDPALLDAARDNLSGVLNSLALTLIEDGGPQAERLADDLGAYAAELERGDGTGMVIPGWLGIVRNDAEFLSRLKVEVDTGETATLALGDWLRRAGRRMLGAGIDLVDGPVARLARGFTPQIASFLGDVLIYLHDGERRRKIRSAIITELVHAARAKNETGAPMIVVGHSMGANILYDLLADREEMAGIENALGAPLDIDLLLTVGTQIGLFAELGLFRETGSGTAWIPPSVNQWWHVYNQMDVLSFGLKGIVPGVSEFSVDTGANIADAHSAYFNSPVFHGRLRKRMIGAGLIT